MGFAPLQFQRLHSLETMLLYLFCLLIASRSAVASNNGDRKNCSSLECVLLDNLILHDIDNDEDPCRDVSSYLCGKDTFSFGKRIGLYSESSFDYNDLLNTITSILNGSKQNEFSENKLKSLKVEKELFKSCMKLENKSVSEMAMEEFDRLRTKNESFNSWQDIDEEFNSLGFGYAFFDINVVRNPRHPENNIIMLQPPMSNLFKIIVRLMSSNFSPITMIEELHSKSRENFANLPNQNVTQFLSSLIKINLNVNDNTTTDEHFKTYISIEKWNQTYNHYYSNHTTAQIDWLRIFTQCFQQINIHISKTEIIFMNQKSYFKKLAKLLSSTSNKVIAEAVTFIWKLQNPAYYGMILPSEFADSQELRKFRSVYCSTETQLYATSYVILHSWQSDETVTHLRRYLLNKITKAIQNEISKSQSLREYVKLYFNKKLNDITLNLIKGNWNQSLVSNYYSDLKLTDNYFTNILNYKRLIRNKKLINLRNSPNIVIENTPFSIIESSGQNNLVNWLLKNFENKNDVLLNRLMSVSKELLFSTYGVKLARFIYLLATNDFHKVGANFISIAQTVPVLDNQNDIFRCFSRNISDRKTWDFWGSLISESTKHQYAIDDIVDSFAIRVSYNAMLDENCDGASQSICNTITNELGLTSEQLFFLAYVKSNCNKPKYLVKVDEVILDVEEYVKVFQCLNSTYLYRSHMEQKCNLTLFDIDEGMFSDAYKSDIYVSVN